MSYIVELDIEDEDDIGRRFRIYRLRKRRRPRKPVDRITRLERLVSNNAKAISKISNDVRSNRYIIRKNETRMNNKFKYERGYINQHMSDIIQMINKLSIRVSKLEKKVK